MCSIKSTFKLRVQPVQSIMDLRMGEFPPDRNVSVLRWDGSWVSVDSRSSKENLSIFHINLWILFACN